MFDWGSEINAGKISGSLKGGAGSTQLTHSGFVATKPWLNT